MNKARKELVKTMRDTDMVIELLDARTPLSSSNPLLAELRGSIPCLKILNKADLADPAITVRWQKYFNAQAGCICLVNSTVKQLSRNDIMTACRKLVASKKALTSNYQILITGIPNVGKSTLLNQVLARKVAKTGNEPALTKGQQRVKLEEGWYLIDSPGMMWPKLEDQTAAYRLASTGTIRNTAVEAADIAWFLAEALIKDFYPNIEKRYKLSGKPSSAEEFLNIIAANNGCLGRGGLADWNKVSELLLNEFRSGKLGRISLESPPDQQNTPVT